MEAGTRGRPLEFLPPEGVVTLRTVPGRIACAAALEAAGRGDDGSAIRRGCPSDS